MSHSITSLSSPELWQWKQHTEGAEYRPVSAFPSEIHVELLKTGAIEHPYDGFGEHYIQWVGEAEWLYKCTFPRPETLLDHTEIEFLGLDTICDVTLNGEHILSADNQFRTFVISVANSLLKEKNELVLHFKSAPKVAKELEEKYGKVRAGSNNLGDPSRVYVRKAQYDWRWDWGPEIQTVGPYRPILLHTYSARILDSYPRATLEPAPTLAVDLALQGTVPKTVKARVSLKDADQVIKQDIISLEGVTDMLKDVTKWGDLNVEKWWPVGYGKQQLYNVEIELLGADDVVLDRVSHKVGFRTIELIQTPLVEADYHGQGTSFYFRVNSVPIFILGSNWIPADNFLTTIDDERYRKWLRILKDGGQNMIRIWGGGIYEPDSFYEACDELGILVWQDFQFACGVYPGNIDWFQQSVRKEAEDNVRRLRTHPSIALFCGNNEDYQMILQWGDVKDFPGVKLYEDILPDVVSRLTSAPDVKRLTPPSLNGTGSIPYHRGSPYGGKGWDTADPTVGDVHQWNVWGGKEYPYHDYDILGGRFVSEFGIPSYPSMKTVKGWMKDLPEEEHHPQSAAVAQHCRAGLYERRLAIAMNENFRPSADLETYAYDTQVMQADAMGYAYKVWRRAWKGEGREFTGGVIVWQLNDCWPVISWAIVDYYLRPKPSYYAIKRQALPITLNMVRRTTQNRPTDRPRSFYEFGAFRTVSAAVELWVSNLSLDVLDTSALSIKLRFIDLKSDWTESQTLKLEASSLLSNQTTEISRIPVPGPPSPFASTTKPLVHTSHTVIVVASLVDTQTGRVLAQDVDWPQPYKYYSHLLTGDRGVTISVNGDEVRVKSARPIKCLWLSVEGDNEPEWSDNGFDVIPGEADVVISAPGLNGREVKAVWLGKEKL